MVKSKSKLKLMAKKTEIVLKMSKQQIEIERKYIIAMPDISRLRELCGFTESRIEQIYLSTASGNTHRVRKRDFGNAVEYTETCKERIDGMSVREREREISENEFMALSKNIAEGTRPLKKIRYTFDFSNQTFELDVYPEWKSTAIMETELKSRDEMVEMPDFITIIREVTGERAYSNASMSRNFPKEEGEGYKAKPW